MEGCFILRLPNRENKGVGAVFYFPLPSLKQFVELFGKTATLS